MNITFQTIELEGLYFENLKFLMEHISCYILASDDYGWPGNKGYYRQRIISILKTIEFDHGPPRKI